MKESKLNSDLEGPFYDNYKWFSEINKGNYQASLELLQNTYNMLEENYLNVFEKLNQRNYIISTHFI